MVAITVGKTGSHLLGSALIKVSHGDTGAFLGQTGGTGPADTVPSTGDNHRGAGEAFKLSMIHGWSLPLCARSSDRGVAIVFSVIQGRQDE
jgi:hypothetical protein